MKSVATSRFVAMLASAITLFASLATPARAETFEFAVWYSDRDFYADYARLWAAEIEKRTEGRVKIKLHFSGALVAAKETVNAVRTGAAGTASGAAPGLRTGAHQCRAGISAIPGPRGTRCSGAAGRRAVVAGDHDPADGRP